MVSHGAAEGSSAADGLVITVDSPFPYALPAATAYYIARSSAVEPVVKAVCSLSDVSPGLYNVICPPLVDTGDYTVEVLSSGRNLSASPAHITVVPSWKCATTSLALGSGLSLATAGASASFTITARDSFAQLSPRGGDVFCVTVDRPGVLVAAGWTCGPSLGGGAVSDLANGAYAVSYTPTRSGTYVLSVSLGGVAPIGASPFTLRVRPAAVCAARCRARGPGLTLATVGAVSRFVVEARDAYANPVERLAATSTCALGGPAGACLLRLSLGGGSVTAVYPPRGSGVAEGQDGPQPDSAAGWDASYTVDAALSPLDSPLLLTVGSASVLNVSGGGLSATYYRTVGLTVPFAAVVDATVDFSGSGLLAGSGDARPHWPWTYGLMPSQTSLSSPAAAFSVRWAGMVNATRGLAYTFVAKLGAQAAGYTGNSGRVRVWIDSNLIIDQWASLATSYPSAVYALGPDPPLHDLTVEYQESAATRAVGLYWDAGPLAGGPQVLSPSRPCCASHALPPLCDVRVCLRSEPSPSFSPSRRMPWGFHTAPLIVVVPILGFPLPRGAVLPARTGRLLHWGQQQKRPSGRCSQKPPLAAALHGRA